MVRVEVVFSPAPRALQRVSAEMPLGSTVADALRTLGPVPDGLACGVWGRRCPPDQVLRDGDRVELYRALTVDPKESRRLRYRGQPKAKRPAKAGR